MNDCIFCKIMNNEIESKTVYEDEIVKVFMDLNPNENGHMLIVPKKHFIDFTELDDKTILHIAHIAKKMKELIYSKLNVDGIVQINNYGIYQVVKHYHLHIIPSYKEKQEIKPIEEIYEQLIK